MDTESFNYPQALCLYRDTENTSVVVDNIVLTPKHKQFLRLTCSLNHETISKIIIDHISQKHVSPSTSSASPLSPLQTYLRHKMDPVNEYIHVFSVIDDYGMVYHLKCVMQPVHTFTVPLRIVPIAGACATGVSTITASELKRRIQANPAVSASYHSWVERVSAPITQNMIPSYMRLSIEIFDPTADGARGYKRDVNTSKPFMQRLNAQFCTSEAEIEVETASLMTQRQCAWPVCGQVDQMKKLKFKFCAGCKRVAYCSEQCQKSDWRYHRLLCKSGRLGQHDPALMTKECRQEPRCLACDKRASKKCARCRLMCYCSRECQVAHWTTHKIQCTELRKKIASIETVVSQHSPPSSKKIQVAPADNQGALVARIPNASNWDQVSKDPRFIFDKSYQQSVPGKSLFTAAQDQRNGELNWTTNAAKERKVIFEHFNVGSVDALMEFMIRTGISMENYILIDMLVDPQLPVHIIEAIAHGMNPILLVNFEKSRIFAPCHELQCATTSQNSQPVSHENETSLESLLQFMRIDVPHLSDTGNDCCHGIQD